MVCLLLNSGFQLIKVKAMHWIISGSCLGKMKVIITYYGMQLILRLFYPQAGLALPFPFPARPFRRG